MTATDHERQFPPLAISDLVVLTLVVAFAYACVAPNYQEALSGGQISALQAAPDLIEYLAQGLLLFGLIVLARQRIRGDLRQLSPGQWIIAAIGPYSVLALAGVLFRPLLEVCFPGQWRITNALDNVVFVLVIGYSLFAAWPPTRRLETRWRIAFGLIFTWLLAGALWCAADAAKSFGFSRRSPWPRHLIAIFTTAEVLAGAAVIVAVAIDAAKGVRRDWLHFLGVVAMVLIVTTALSTWGWSTAKWWQDLFFHIVP